VRSLCPPSRRGRGTARHQRGRSQPHRALAPFNRTRIRHFLREAGAKGSANAIELARAPRAGSFEPAVPLDDLAASISAARFQQLTAPGRALLNVAMLGFAARLRRARPISRLRSFDPELVGLLECDAWVAYYEHRWARLLWASVALVRSGSHLGAMKTMRGGWHVLRAIQLWAPVPDNDSEGAVKHMVHFYRLLRDREGEPINPEVAAALEVEWWRVHRSLQQIDAGAGFTVADLEAALARLYAHLYSIDESAVRLAARERAQAMIISDRWIEGGRDPRSPHLASEAAALIRSYTALLAAVQKQPTRVVALPGSN
jgi:hypothetical protein